MRNTAASVPHKAFAVCALNKNDIVIVPYSSQMPASKQPQLDKHGYKWAFPEGPDMIAIDYDIKSAQPTTFYATTQNNAEIKEKDGRTTISPYWMIREGTGSHYNLQKIIVTVAPTGVKGIQAKGAWNGVIAAIQSVQKLSISFPVTVLLRKIKEGEELFMLMA